LIEDFKRILEVNHPGLEESGGVDDGSVGQVCGEITELDRSYTDTPRLKSHYIIFQIGKQVNVLSQGCENRMHSS
jgi:hypothetical protein